MKRMLFGAVAFLAGVALVESPAVSQPPGGKDGKAKDGKGKGAKGAVVGAVFPPALLEELKLTDAQKVKLDEIEKHLKGELDKLLTDEQKKTVENFRPAGPGAKGGKAPPPPAGGNGEKAPAPVEKGKDDDRTGLLKDAPAIQWYATLDRGLAEAKRTGKPILFVSAAPHCAGVSGMWWPGKVTMDRSFLSQPPVIAAARKFVCIRLTSYEDETEKAFVAALVRGEVANTAFAILTPDGKPALKGQGPGRGPRDLFADAAEMAKGMDALAARYEIKKAEGAPALPVALSVKVGLAVAAGDNQPLVVVLSPDPKRLKELEAQVAAFAWDKAFEGRFTYASGSELKDLPKVKGLTLTEGVVVIDPDVFGAGGKVVKEVAADQIAAKLPPALTDTLKTFVPPVKTRRELANLGLKEGIFYETGIPVSGKGEAADRERYKQLLDKKK